MAFVILIAAWLVIALAVFRSETPLAAATRPRLLPLLGVALIVGSFIFQEWVRFDFIQYLHMGLGDLLRDLAPDAIGLLGSTESSRLLGVLLGKATLTGWQLTIFAPFWGFWIQAAIVFPTLLALATLAWLPLGATYSGGRICKLVGFLLAALSLAGLVGLVAAIPALDALGMHDQFHWAILTVLLGVKLEMGPWLTMLGLALLLVGGLIEIGSSRAGKAIEPLETSWP
jgi:hypothetical protein